MSDFNFISLSRQSGLMREMSVIANNVANSNTTGFKRERAVFSEFIVKANSPFNTKNAKDSISMGRLGAHASDMSNGGLSATQGQFDVALESEGFFQVQVDNNAQLTRNGHFQLDLDGRLITQDGYPVLDPGGGEILIPLEVDKISISPNGTLSADGIEYGQIGVVSAPPDSLQRAGDNLWISDQVDVLETPKMRQGFLEGSNVNPVAEIARMIEVQRSYDAGIKLIALNDDRLKQLISTVRQIR